MSPLRVIVLGSGTSHGVPMIGCDCPVCTSTDPRDKRTRSSILIALAQEPEAQARDDQAPEAPARGTQEPEVQARDTGNRDANDPRSRFGLPGVRRNILVDTTPELRLQCLANDVRRVDAVLFTHNHADHVVGLDDLRRFNHLQGTAITCHADAHTAGALEKMFPYAFDQRGEYVSSKPQLHLSVIEGPFDLFGTQIVPVPLFHGRLPVLGFRVERFAYCTDVSRIPDESWPLLEGLEVLILDGLRHRPHPTHFNLEQAVEAARRIGAQQTYFTHIAHELAHEATNATLPPGMALAYDGQRIEM